MKSHKIDADLTEEESEYLIKIIKLMREVEFGQLIINLQNSKIVQIERVEKFRINEL